MYYIALKLCYDNELYLQAQKKEKSKNSRFFEKEEVQSRQTGFAKKEKKRKGKTNSLIMALPKVNRLRKKNDFDLAFKKGVGYKNSCFVLKVAKNGLDHARFGVVVSKKVSLKAVERNKARRRVSEFLRVNLKDIKRGLDLVFVCLPGINKKDFSEIKNDTSALLIKAKILNV